jgi:hypothetical protein
MFRPTVSVVLVALLVAIAGPPAGATPARPSDDPTTAKSADGADKAEAAVTWPKEVMVEMPKDPVQRRAKIRELRREHGRVVRTVASRLRSRPGLDFERTSVKNVLEYLAEIGNFSVIFDTALEEQGIDLEAQTVTLKVSGITYEKAIELILPQGVGYRIGPGYVLVTTMEKSWLPLITKSYSVRLHLARIPDFDDAPRFNIGDVTQATAQAASGGGGGGFNLFDDIGGTPEEKQVATPEELMDIIKRLVSNDNDRRIAPWADMGGPASIEYLNGRLVVNQTDHGHRAVWRILTMLE